MDPNAVADDFNAFNAPPPEEAAAQEKARAKAKAANKVTPAQLKAAEKLSDDMKAEKEATEKARLLRLIHDYLNFMKEHCADRLEFLKLPKTISPKLSLEELRILVKDIEAELGKKSGLGIVKMLWCEASRVFEKVNENQRFGIDSRGLYQNAQMSVMDRKLPDGSIIHGPAVPTLAEFAVKHSAWFSSSVEWRLAMMFAEMVAAVHRMNTTVPQAQAKETSKETEDLMKDL